MAGYSARQSTFTSGDTITAAHSNDEFNQLLAAFHATTGHTHDGTAGDGGPVTTIRDSNGYNKILLDTSNNHLEFYVNVSSAAVQQIRIQDGAIVPITDDDIDIGTSSLQFKNAYFDGTLEADAITVGGTSVLTGGAETAITSLLNTNLVIGRDSDNDIDFATDNNIIIRAAGADQIQLADGVLKPVTDNDIDLGTSSLEFKDAYFDGTVTADALVADTADINGGSVDGATIGASSASTIVGTTITANTSILPDSSGGADIGSTGAEWGDVFIADDKAIKFGSDQDVTIEYDEDGTDTLLISGDATFADDKKLYFGTNKDISIEYDEDGTDKLVITGNTTFADGSYDFDIASHDTSNGLKLGGTLVTSTAAELNILDGVTATASELNIMDGVTSTATEINILDGDNSASTVTIADADRIILNDNGTMKQVAVSALNTYTSASIAADDITTGDGAVTLATSSGNITIDAQAGDADIIFKGTDSSSDITALTLDMSAAGAATFNDKVVATELDISGNMDIDGTSNLDAVDIDGAVQIDAGVTVGVDDTGQDVKFFGATSGSFLLWDESDDALELTDSSPIKIGDGGDMQLYHDGSNSYLTNSQGALKIATETSGIAITLGHSTSEITVADNLTVTGDLTVSGTTTTVNSTTVNLNDHNIVLDSGNSTSAVINGGGITLEGGSGDDASFTYNTTGPKWELKLGSSYESLQLDALIAASLDISGDVDIDGTLEADAITVDGTTLAEYIADTAGAMASSNTETGITVTYQDADNTIDFALDASQTVFTSITNTSLVVGRDADNDIDFATDNTILFRAEGADQIKLVDGALAPVTDDDIDLGTSSLQFKDGYFDGTLEADAITVGGTAVLTGGAETAITSIYNSSLALGYGSSHANIDFSTDNSIIFDIDGTSQIQLDDGILKPTTDNDVDLGTSSLEFKDGYFDGTLYCDTLNLNGTNHTSIEDPTALAIALG